MTSELLFRGATVYTPDGPGDFDVVVSDGVITGVHPPGRAGGRVVDVSGKWLLPGGIDAHVHSRDPGFPEKEDFDTLTAAAAAGGVTTVIDMPNTVPAVDSAGVLEAKAALARSKARVDFGLWALIRSTSTSEQLQELASAGAVGFKAYLGYSFSLSRKQVLHALDAGDPDIEAPPDYGTLTRLAAAIAEIGLPLVIHAEDPGILHTFRRPYETYADVLAARPAEAEAVAIAATASVARQHGIHLHVAHLSSALGLQAAEEAIAAGTRLSLETCPQYLWRTDADFALLGTAMKMNPPVRTNADQRALRDALKREVIGIVATDHAPHADAEKAQDLEHSPPGTPGVQTLYLSCLELAKQMGDPWLAAKWVGEGPAALAGLGESKGRIAPGYDADLVVVDPTRTTTFSPRAMRSRQKHSAMEGLKVSFAITSVFLRGALVYANGRAAPRASGRMVRPIE